MLSYQVSPLGRFVLSLDKFEGIFGKFLTAFVSTGQLECKNYGRKGRECKRINIYLTHPTTTPPTTAAFSLPSYSGSKPDVYTLIRHRRVA